MNRRKTAIVTGASSGIGQAVAKYFAEKGYTLLVISRTETALDALRTTLPGSGHMIAALDVANRHHVQNMFAELLEKFGHIDVLFNSAGYVKRGTCDLAEEEIRQMLDTNFLGVKNMVDAVVPDMKRAQRGYIMTVASYSGIAPRAHLGGYAASKAAVVAFCDSLFQELVPLGLSVTTLCPSMVDTPMTADVVSIPPHKKVRINDVIHTVDFLLSLSPAACVKEISIQCRARFI